MIHDYHQGLPGYVEGAIFQDGCEECEARAKDFSVGHMDMHTWARARARALELQVTGLDKVSRCEYPVLRVIGNVLLMEREHLVTQAAEFDRQAIAGMQERAERER